jgi:hypothetical protein
VPLIVEKLVKLPAFSHCFKFSKIVRLCLNFFISNMMLTSSIIIFTQLRKIFGSTHHGPRALFKKHAKFGRNINLLKP